jgi:hypothetical protein
MDDTRKATIRISQSSARYVQADTPREERLKAARCAAEIPLSELHVVLFLLSRDPDAEIRTTAMDGLRRLPEGSLVTICSSPDTHPRILALLAKLHFQNAAVSGAISLNPSADESTRVFIEEKGVAPTDESIEIQSCEVAREISPEADVTSDIDGAEEGEDSVEESEEAFRSKYQLTQEMGISEKIKMAITGDKEWRMLLIKDTNKLVSGAVIKNPRLTEAEVLFISKSPVNNDDIIRDICTNKEWTKNYQIKKALVENHKTPLHHALRFLSGLTDKDLAVLAKSKNVSSIIATQARRSLLNKKKEK